MSRFHSHNTRGDASQVPGLPDMKEAREALAMSHYDLVRGIAGSLKDAQVDLVRDIFESLISHDSIRAALVASDVYASVTKSSLRVGEESRALCDILVGCRGADLLQNEISRLPTVDAFRARVDVYKVDLVESMARILAPMAVVRGAAERDLSDVVRILDDRGASGEYGSSRERVSQATFKEMAERFHPLTDVAALSPQHQQVIADFYRTWGDRLRPELYGYERNSSLLTLEQDVRRLSGLAARATGGDEGYAVRLREKALRARVFAPYDESPDRVSEHGHQCVDSASVARSFFSERGIPSDIFLVTIGEMFHNLTVCYFSAHDKYVPVVVDASPFGGFYPNSGEGAPSYWRPQSVVHVRGVRESSLPFVDGFLGPRSPSGMIPWFCEESTLGRVVGFAGVCDRQLHPERQLERGTDEWYGNGKKVRYPAVSLTLFSRSGAESTIQMPKAMFVLDGDSVRVEESSKGCSPDVLAELRRIAAAHLGSVRDTIKRLSIPIGSFTAES